MDYQKIKEVNNKFAFEQLKIDADKGHLFCQHQVAMMYENGIGTAKNPEKAFEYYEKAANQGHAVAQFELGLMYKNGEGTAKDMKKAFEYFEKAANQGHAVAQFELEKLLSSKCKSANPSSSQLTQPIQPIAVKRPFVLNMSESSAFSAAKKQTIQID